MNNLIEAVATYWHGADLVAFLLITSVFIEISPIKFNPLQWFTNLLQKKLTTQLDSISNKLEDFSDRIDKIEINDMRSTILSFGNSCMKHEEHTQEEFAHIFALYDRYESIIESSGLSNGQVDVCYEYIRQVYKDCLKNNTFSDLR